MDKRLLIHLDQFVAGGDNGDARPGKYLKLGRTTGGGRGDLGSRDTRTPGTTTARAWASAPLATMFSPEAMLRP